MIIQRSMEKTPPILVQPRHDVDDLKTPKQQRLERETSIKNDMTKKYAQNVVDEVYKEMERIVQNTEYNVSYELDNFGAAKQIKFSMKKDGTVVAAIPPDMAAWIAENAKHTTIGLLFDFPA